MTYCKLYEYTFPHNVNLHMLSHILGLLEQQADKFSDSIKNDDELII